MSDSSTLTHHQSGFSLVKEIVMSSAFFNSGEGMLRILFCEELWFTCKDENTSNIYLFEYEDVDLSKHDFFKLTKVIPGVEILKPVSEVSWNVRTHKRGVDPKIDAFLVDLMKLYLEHNLVIAHEDIKGEFRIVAIEETIKNVFLGKLQEENDATGDTGYW